MPPASRVTDIHSCPISTAAGVPASGVVVQGAATVLIGNLPAARLGDQHSCFTATGVIVSGSTSVLIENMPAARLGDMTADGGTIDSGLPTVLIGG